MTSSGKTIRWTFYAVSVVFSRALESSNKALRFVPDAAYFHLPNPSLTDGLVQQDFMNLPVYTLNEIPLRLLKVEPCWLVYFLNSLHFNVLHIYRLLEHKNLSPSELREEKKEKKPLLPFFLTKTFYILIKRPTSLNLIYIFRGWFVKNLTECKWLWGHDPIFQLLFWPRKNYTNWNV